MQDQCESLSYSGGADERLAELLISRGKLSANDVERIARTSNSEKLSHLLVKSGMVAERDMAIVLADFLQRPLAGNADYPDLSVLNERVSVRFLKEHLVIAIAESDNVIDLAMADPQDDFVISAMELACGKSVNPWVGVPSEIEEAIEQHYGDGKSRMGQILEQVDPGDDAEEEDIEQLRDLASEAPVIRLVSLIMQHAVEIAASDIHIEPFEHRLKVRYRVDGVMQEAEAPPAHLTAAVISRIKIMANLNIAERRLPQDGRVRLRVQGKPLDVRVSTVPTLHGESVVMRLLNQESVSHDFTALGIYDDDLKRLREVLALPHGMILVTGPTGSGKTTTLYTALHSLNTSERKIITVEDPVEYQIEGINQIQVKPGIGLTFAGVLRSIVRQDPDVIMVGEMRDLEAAGICVQSALTGHLVLSTLHTNDAAGSIIRLLEMGVEDYLLTSTLNAIIGQRLVRTLCTHCRTPRNPSPESLQKTGLDRLVSERATVPNEPPITYETPIIYERGGCDKCGGCGYRGRTTILELMVMSDSIQRLILQHAQADEIRQASKQEGMRTMYEDGLRKVLAGVTTLEEVLRVTHEG